MTSAESVWLGSYVVATDVLAGPGSTLYSLLGVDHGIIDPIAGLPPVDGWRVIAGELPASATVDTRPVVIAAPWDNPRSNGWMVVSVTRSGGRWHAMIMVDRRPVEPFLDPSVRWTVLTRLFGAPWQVRQLRSHDGQVDTVLEAASVVFRPGRDGVGVGTYNDGRSTGHACSCEELGDDRLSFGTWSNNLAGGPRLLPHRQCQDFFQTLTGPVRWAVEEHQLTLRQDDGAQVVLSRANA